MRVISIEEQNQISGGCNECDARLSELAMIMGAASITGGLVGASIAYDPFVGFAMGAIVSGSFIPMVIITSAAYFIGLEMTIELLGYSKHSEQLP